jgi:hypothetical protein
MFSLYLGAVSNTDDERRLDALFAAASIAFASVLLTANETVAVVLNAEAVMGG